MKHKDRAPFKQHKWQHSSNRTHILNEAQIKFPIFCPKKKNRIILREELRMT
jgi:hypothetical protein